MSFKDNYNMLQEVECSIKAIAGRDPAMLRMKKDNEMAEKLSMLVFERRMLLNGMFMGTDEEIARFRHINEKLLDLTGKMYRRTGNLYRTVLSDRDETFDDDFEVEGWIDVGIDFDPEDEEDDDEGVLRLPSDAVYGSDFRYMLNLLSNNDLPFISMPHVEYCHTSHKSSHAPGSDNKALGLTDLFNDGESWVNGPLRRAEFEAICICHAVKVICTDMDYSIPDLLRINDFWVESQILCQHFARTV